MEDYLNFFENGRQPKFVENGRRPHFLKMDDCLKNDDDKVGEFEKYVWVLGELKSGFRLFRTEVSLRLPRYSLSTVQVTNNIFVQLGHGIKNVS